MKEQLDRIERKLDVIDEKVDDALRWQAASEAACKEKHRSIASILSEDRARIIDLEKRGWKIFGAILSVAMLASAIASLVVTYLK